MYEELNKQIPNLDRYLDRLGVSRSLTPNRAYLDCLIFAHQCNVPFENLDVFDYRRPISLGIPELYEKIIVNHRGGYCFELNTLFSQLLRELGFQASSCLCRIIRKKDFLPPTLHCGVLVEIDGQKYFCDVGYGGPMPPASLPVQDGIRETLRGETYLLSRSDDIWWTMSRITSSGKPEKILQFYTMPQDIVNFIPINYYCSTSPDSVFTQKRFLNIRTEKGSDSITDNLFTHTADGKITTRTITDRTELKTIMQKYFHIPVATI